MWNKGHVFLTRNRSSVLHLGKLLMKVFANMADFVTVRDQYVERFARANRSEKTGNNRDL